MDDKEAGVGQEDADSPPTLICNRPNRPTEYGTIAKENYGTTITNHYDTAIK